MIINSPWLKNLINKDYDSLSQLVKDLHIDSTLLNVNRYFSGTGKMNEYYSKIDDSLAQIASMTNEELENYLKDTTELTEMEKIQNYLSFTKDWLESKNSWFNLSNIAFGMYIASGFTKVIGGIGKFIGGWANGGGLAGGLSSLLGVGGAAGGAGGAGSIAGLLSAGGPILGALGIIGVAATAAAVAAKAIASRNNDDAHNYSNASGNLFREYTQNQHMNTAQAAVQSMNEAQSINKGGFFSNQYGIYNENEDNGLYSGGIAVQTGRGPTEAADMMQAFYMEDSDVRQKYLGKDVHWWLGGDAEARNALKRALKSRDGKTYNLIKGYALSKMLQSQNMADTYLKSQLMAALLIAAYKQNALNRTELSEALSDPGGMAFNGWTSSKKGIQNYLEAAGIKNVSQLSRFYALLDTYDAYFMLNDGSFLGYPNSRDQLNDIASEFGLDGYHLAGKDYIPRDNYRALLHKGEMVLNAKEAAFYRSMFPYGGESDKVPRPAGRIVTGLPWTMTAGYPSYPKGSQHRGVDFGIPIGTAVGAAMSGIVVDANNKVNYNTYGSGVRSFGEYVLIKGNNGLYYRYGHLSKLGVIPGQIVNAGDTIGLSGNTGYSTGPHLHFQVQTGTGNTTDISPYSYITAGLFQAKGDISIPGISTGVNSTTPGTEEGVKVSPSKRFIPTAFQHGGIGGGEDSATRISGSVNSGINRIIDYLENVRAEQKEQRELINAFSQTRMSDSNF